METFGERLKFLIKKSDIKTIKNFSKKAGVHEVSISNIIRGRNNPSFDVIQACMNNFSDSEVIWLLSGRDFKSKMELENKQLKEKVEFYEKTLGTIAKPSSNRVNPQLSLDGFEPHKSANLA